MPRAHDSDRKTPEQPTDDQQKVRAVARWENEGGAQRESQGGWRRSA